MKWSYLFRISVEANNVILFYSFADVFFNVTII